MDILHPLCILGGSLGAGELIVVFAAALLLFGSKNLPRIARTLGRAIEELRKGAREFSNEITKADAPPRPDSANRERGGEGEPHDRAG